MHSSKELALAKILLWQVLGGGEGSKEQWWRAQRPEVKEHWLNLAKRILAEEVVDTGAAYARGIRDGQHSILTQRAGHTCDRCIEIG